MNAHAEDTIEAIRFVGNKVTKEETMRLEMIVHEGDPVDIAKIEKSVQNIMDLGIFQRVSYYLEQTGPDRGTDLVIVVIEPFYWYALPTFKLNDDSQLEVGARLKWNNLWGYNHTMLITGTDQGYRGGVQEYSSSFDYTMPRFMLSRYALSIRLGRSQRLDNDNDLGDQREITKDYGFSVSKWLNDDGISFGPFLGAGVDFQQQYNEAVDPANESDGYYDNIIYSVTLGTDETHKYEFQRGGNHLVYDVSFSSSFFQQAVSYRRYRILSKENVTNINYLVSAGLADNNRLGNAAFSLGGNSSLRGYKKDSYRGNIFYRASIEYLTKFNRSPLVRKAFFLDLGDIHDEFSDFRFSTIKYGAGAGIRWKARRFVNIDIRLDIAYGFQSRDLRVVLGSHNTF